MKKEPERDGITKQVPKKAVHKENGSLRDRGRLGLAGRGRGLSAGFTCRGFFFLSASLIARHFRYDRILNSRSINEPSEVGSWRQKTNSMGCHKEILGWPGASLPAVCSIT
jgi:hypothetical protein